ASSGAAGVLDPIVDTNAAYSVNLQSGTTYKIDLANLSKRGCVSGALYPPGTNQFATGQAALNLRCSSYTVFTPGPGEGGTYTFQLLPTTSDLGSQRYHLEVQAAGPADGGPGVPIGNLATLKGSLDAAHDDVVRLYRFNVIYRGQLTLVQR